jgi:hypothetical protein
VPVHVANDAAYSFIVEEFPALSIESIQACDEEVHCICITMKMNKSNKQSEYICINE